jgi:hypothetical protein
MHAEYVNAGEKGINAAKYAALIFHQHFESHFNNRRAQYNKK